MDDTLWTVAKALRNERSAAIEQQPLPETAEPAQPFQVRRLVVTTLVAAALVVFHLALG